MRAGLLAAALLAAALGCSAAGPQDANEGAVPRSGIASIPGVERGVLIQSRGSEWRKLRPPIVVAGGVVLAGSIAALLAFYLWRGPIRVSAAPTGRLIERFTAADRVAHWSMGLSFVALALTGLILTAGRPVLLPIVGHGIFSPLALGSKNIHAFLGPVFLVSLAYFILRFVRDNLPRRHDIDWLLKSGGMFSGKHVPSGRFNAGEKTLFWGLVCGMCIILGATGLILDFPNLEQGRSLMQDASVIHLAIAFLAISASLFHMYLGTLGVQGAYRAMRDGTVDESWAREHHEIWCNEVKAGKSRQHFVEPVQPLAAAPAGDD